MRVNTNPADEYYKTVVPDAGTGMMREQRYGHPGEVYPCPRHSGSDCVEKPAALDNLFNICDDTLNSWKEVHDDFHELQGDALNPTADAHRAFVRHCHHALWCADLPLPSKYGMKIVAHALLKVWIENHQKELSYEAERTTRRQ